MTEQIKPPWYRRPFALTLAVLATLASMGVIQLGLRQEKKPPKLPFADIAALQPGHYLTVDTDSFRYFVIYPPAGDLYVLAAPAQEGAVRMPEGYWWKPKMHCAKFILGAGDGIVTQESQFHCNDADQPADWAPRWRWNARGEHLPSKDSQRVDNLYGVRFERSDGRIVFVGLAAE